MNGRGNSAYNQNHQENKLSVNERLYKDATDRLERNFFAQGDAGQYGGQSASARHRPSISQTSKQMAQGNQMFQGNLKNFHERQNEFLKKQMEKKQEISNKYGEQA